MDGRVDKPRKTRNRAKIDRMMRHRLGTRAVHLLQREI